MTSSIQAHIIKKLFLWGILCSLLSGGIISYLELQRVDEKVKMLAFTVAENFYELYYKYYTDNSEETKLELERQLS